ncbi:MAG TPA: AMP-binding protein [Gemmatimonadaceae bacterium]|nr:AMP-binding protein [Gemmatimonadaceae bacterium]
MTTPGTQPRSVAGLLWDAARIAGDKPAIISASGTTSYAELRDRAGSIAAALVECGVERGDRVAILAERGRNAAAAYFGALAAGAIAIIVNERLRPRQVEYVLRRAGVRVLLTTREMLAEHQRDLETDATLVELASIPDTRREWTPLPPGDAGLAQIIFTSGSTGLPKGVVFSHRAVLDAMEMVVGYLGFRTDERILSLLPFSSVYGLNQLLSAVMTTSALVISLSPLAAKIVADARAFEVTCIAGVPPLWLQLLAVPAFTSSPIPSLRILQNAGGHLPPEAAKQLRAAHPHARLFLQYGMTECFRSTFLPPEEVDSHPDCMGRTVPGATIWVVDENGRVCAPGEVGELVFSGPTLAEGYWEDPEQTAATFRHAPVGSGSTARAVYSGDMVKRDAEGRFFYVSRRDRMIKSLGFRIGPDEITDVLYASGDILEAAIATEPDPARGERIIAYVALKPGASLKHLEQFARLELPRHMQPARIEVRETLPRLPSGKYDIPAMKAGVTLTAR